MQVRSAEKDAFSATRFERAEGIVPFRVIKPDKEASEWGLMISRNGNAVHWRALVKLLCERKGVTFTPFLDKILRYVVRRGSTQC